MWDELKVAAAAALSPFVPIAPSTDPNALDFLEEISIPSEAMTQNVILFFEKVQNTPELAARLGSIESLPLDQRKESLLAFAEELGTPVSVADLKSFGEQAEIPDAALEGVAGGMFIRHHQTKKNVEGGESSSFGADFKEFLTHFGINL